MPFAITPQPATTPWGIAHIATQILPGIWEVSTASHGGMILSDERQAAMPEALGRASAAYEEDVDWSLVVLAFEAEFRSSALRFSPHHVDLARQIVRTWRSERYTAHAGEPVPLNESPILRRRAAALAAVGELVTTSAFGDWAHWVPEGQVGVVARRIEVVCALGFPRYGEERVWGLVTKKAYAARTEVTLLASLSPTILDEEPEAPTSGASDLKQKGLNRRIS